jgi:hypothetical protein
VIIIGDEKIAYVYLELDYSYSVQNLPNISGVPRMSIVGIYRLNWERSLIDVSQLNTYPLTYSSHLLLDPTKAPRYLDPVVNIYVYACRSLVNLVMPSEQNVEQLDDNEAIMENLKLRHVTSNFDDLLCYYQSYYPLQLAARAMFQIDPNNRAHTNN